MPIKSIWDLTSPDKDDEDEDKPTPPTVAGKFEFNPKLFTQKPESEPEPEEDEKPPSHLSPEERMEWIVRQLDKKRKPIKGKRTLADLERNLDAEFLRRAEETGPLTSGSVDGMATEDTLTAMLLMKLLLEENPSMDDLMGEIATLVKERGGRRVITLLCGLLVSLRTQVIQKLGEQLGGQGAIPHFHVASKEEFQRQTGIDPETIGQFAITHGKLKDKEPDDDYDEDEDDEEEDDDYDDEDDEDD